MPSGVLWIAPTAALFGVPGLALLGDYGRHNPPGMASTDAGNAAILYAAPCEYRAWRCDRPRRSFTAAGSSPMTHVGTAQLEHTVPVTQTRCSSCDSAAVLTSSGLCEMCSAHEPEPSFDFMEIVSAEEDEHIEFASCAVGQPYLCPCGMPILVCLIGSEGCRR